MSILGVHSETELVMLFREAVNSDKVGAIKRATIEKLYWRASQNGLDGQYLHFLALKSVYEPPKVPKKGVTIGSVRIMQEDEQYVCNSCGESFKNPKSLAGHGPERCRKKKEAL